MTNRQYPKRQDLTNLVGGPDGLIERTRQQDIRDEQDVGAAFPGHRFLDVSSGDTLAVGFDLVVFNGTKSFDPDELYDDNSGIFAPTEAGFYLLQFTMSVRPNDEGVLQYGIHDAAGAADNWHGGYKTLPVYAPPTGLTNRRQSISYVNVLETDGTREWVPQTHWDPEDGVSTCLWDGNTQTNNFFGWRVH